MKEINTNRRRLLWSVMATMLFVGTSVAQNASNLSTSTPTISYQGVLTSNSGQVIPDGDYLITTTLYVDPDGSNFVWRDSYSAHVAGGLFSVELGSGQSPLPRLSTLDKPLWVGVSIGGEELRPLTKLSSAPYALNVADNSITAKKMATPFVGGVSVDGTPVIMKGETLNLRGGGGVELNYDEATHSLLFNLAGEAGHADTKVQGIAFNPLGTNNDGGGPGNTNFIGGGAQNTTLTGMGAPLNFSTIGGGRTNTNTADYTFIGGGTNNAASGTYAAIGGGGNNMAQGCGSFIGGGGIDCSAAANPNIASGLETTIGGGDGNQAINDWAIVGGGKNNTAGVAGGPGITQTVGGGENNWAMGDGTAICGGEGNTATDMHSYIGGGFGNTTNIAATHSTIGGGMANTIWNHFGTIGGGRMNVAGVTGALDSNQVVGGGASNQALGNGTSILGGEGNTANDLYSSIGGGLTNTTIVGATYATIGGGTVNTVKSEYATIGGGRGNVAGNGISTDITQTVGGGDGNQALGDGATVAGGEHNSATDTHSFVGGGRGNVTIGGATHATIGGGLMNTVNSGFATIAGGWNNVAGNGTTTDSNQFIGGGDHNKALGNSAATVGGEWNIGNADFSAIGGGSSNTTIAGAAYATISGGRENVAGSAMYGGITQTVGGGDGNRALGDGTTIAGGEDNTATMLHSFIGGGRGNTTTANATHSVISGGLSNTADGDFSVILGGSMNQTILGATYSVASGNDAYATQYGQHAHANGMFAAPGDAQTDVYVERGMTSAGSPTANLALDGGALELALAANQSITFRIIVTARDATGGLGGSASYIVEGNATESFGVVTIVASAVTTYVNGFATGGIALVAAPGAVLRIAVNDASATPGNVRWVARIHTADVTN